MSGCVGNIRTKNYQNLIIGFQVTAKNVGDVLFGTQCTTTVSQKKTVNIVFVITLSNFY